MTIVPTGRAAPGRVHGHQHGEAFCLMTYWCEVCGRRERLWNSRDGVTPFGIHCPDCRSSGSRMAFGEMRHVDWQHDVYAPDHQPYRGQRVFRDGTMAEAAAIMRARLEKGRGTTFEVPESEWEAVIASAVHADFGEFQRGWPMVDVWIGEERAG